MSESGNKYKEEFLKDWEKHEERRCYESSSEYQYAATRFENEQRLAVSRCTLKFQEQERQAYFAERNGYDWTKIVDQNDYLDYRTRGMKEQGDYYLYHARKNTQGDGVLWLLVATPFIIIFGGGVVAGLTWAVGIWAFYIIVICSCRNEELNVTPYIREQRIAQYFKWCKKQEEKKVQKEWEDKKDAWIAEEIEKMKRS